MAEEETGTANSSITPEQPKLNPESLKDKMDKLIGIFEEQGKRKKKGKQFRLPFGMGNKKKIQKGWVIVILLKTNKTMDIKFLPIENEMVYLKDNETFHLAAVDFVMRYKKYPVIILPEWDLKPISVDELMGKCREDNNWALPQKVIINASKLIASQKKKGFGGGIIWIVIIIAAAYFIMQMFKK